MKPQLSAGRVQSVAVRLVVEREQERIDFTSADWWGIKAQFSADGEAFEGTLKTWENKVLATGRDFDDSGQLTKRGASVG